MRGVRVVLATGFSGAGPTSLALAEICGHDELAVDGIDTRAAIGLLDRLIDPGLGGAQTVCASDRDALFVALYQRLWGDRISATQDCSACGEKFDLSFQLSALQTHLWTQRPAAEDAPPVPWGMDELTASEKGALAGVQQLMAKLGIDPDQLDIACEALQSHYPLLDLELDNTCPECGQVQQAHFDLQSFLLMRLLGERPRLYAEIHALAAGYGWPLHDILGLPRNTRRVLVDRVEAGGSGSVV